MNHLPIACLTAVVCRLAVFGATVGDALVAVALAGLHGFQLYLANRPKEEAVNDQVHKELAELKSAVGALKVAKTFIR